MKLTLKQIRQETPTVKSFLFNKPPGFSFKAGQFMRFTFSVKFCDERCNSRPFSLASSPSEDKLMITTRVGTSALKKKLDKMEKGSKVKAIGPLGKFILDKTNNPILMLAGGIGITPLRSMIKYLIDNKIKRQVTLLYSNKTLEAIVYSEELKKWNKKHDNITVVHTITGRNAPAGRLYKQHGRIDKEMVKNYTSNTKNTQFYTCGPPKMVEAMEKLVKNLGAPAEHIHAERFAGY